jgi:hypothetical protein
MPVIHKNRPHGECGIENDFEQKKTGMCQVLPAQHPQGQECAAGAKRNTVAYTDKADKCIMVKVTDMRGKKNNQGHGFKDQADQRDDMDAVEAAPVHVFLCFFPDRWVHILDKSFQQLLTTSYSLLQRQIPASVHCEVFFRDREHILPVLEKIAR